MIDSVYNQMEFSFHGPPKAVLMMIETGERMLPCLEAYYAGEGDISWRRGVEDWMRHYEMVRRSFSVIRGVHLPKVYFRMERNPNRHLHEMFDMMARGARFE